MTKSAKSIVLAGAICCSLLAGCSSGPPAAKQPAAAEAAHDHRSHAANGDLQETTASLQELPSFLTAQANEIYLAYKAASTITDLLGWIPCYCGCGESAGHKSNLNCFISEIKADGSVVWDDHGTRCGVCMEIALKAALMKQEGKTVKEIRTTIDAEYKTGYAKPTPTPMPSV
ncbi:conserved hypothetical protein [Paenibacillus curdlanolyticus YK9]|uniref:Lipoprotein n=1 Tax=Paenibacillus curdlanolyticus YK9 TaxID=717606 RepID=E0I662_9BACL|nr:conserved hypothetical protein [Paenibacillus curdlanolyticus YK9]